MLQTLSVNGTFIAEERTLRHGVARGGILNEHEQAAILQSLLRRAGGVIHRTDGFLTDSSPRGSTDFQARPRH